MFLLTMIPPAGGGLSFYIRTSFNASSLLLLAFMTFCQATSAQKIQPQSPPVARLISDPASDITHSRPRRVRVPNERDTSIEVGPSASPSIEEATAIEKRAFERTNEARIAQGLAPLTWDPYLCRMAREHSESMARQGYFSHETLEGLHLRDRARATGIPHYRVIGENIAYNKGYEDPGGFAVERWMISPGHRANILYVAFQASAIGSYVSTDGSVYLTQVFIAR